MDDLRDDSRLTRWAPRVALLVAVVCVVATAASVWLYFVNRGHVPVNYLYGDVSAGLLYPCTGALLLRLRPTNRLGWLFAVTAPSGLNGLANQYAVWAFLVHGHPGWLGDLAAWYAGWGWAPVLLVPAVLPIVFPSGHLPSRRWRPVVVAAVVALSALIVVLAIGKHPIDASEHVWNPWALTDAQPLHAVPALSLLVLVACLLLGLGSLLVRMRRAQPGVERARLSWFLFAVVVSILALLATAILPEPLSEAAYTVGIAALPAGVVVALLRHRLLDVDVVLNRTIVYGFLTVVILLVYLVATALLGDIAAQRLGIASVAVVALVLASARDRMQHGVDRALFGERHDPYAVVSRLGERIEAAAGPLQGVQETVDELARALRLPYVAVQPLGAAVVLGGPVESGRAVAGTFELPVAVHGEPLAQLVVGRRHAGERVGERELSLLHEAGRRIGTLVQAAVLVDDLRASRERLVSAREEERRRLRHDLHDSVGPQLAGLALQLDGLGRRLHEDPDGLARVERLRAQLRETVREVRGVVDQLRPPALDDVGLVEALRQALASFTPAAAAGAEGPDGAGGSSVRTAVRVDVRAAAELPPLPAAVEVAAYRIATEAVTNAVRHGAASQCTVSLEADDGWLAVEVVDDGGGFTPGTRRGVGMTSMEERAQEIGGRLEVVSSPAGTTVRALLPAGTR